MLFCFIFFLITMSIDFSYSFIVSFVISYLFYFYLFLSIISCFLYFCKRHLFLKFLFSPLSNFCFCFQGGSNGFCQTFWFWSKWYWKCGGHHCLFWRQRGLHCRFNLIIGWTWRRGWTGRSGGSHSEDIYWKNSWNILRGSQTSGCMRIWG